MNIATYEEFCILTVYGKFVVPPTKSVMFRWKRTRRQAFLKIISAQNRRKKWLETFLCAAAMLAYLQLWQRLRSWMVNVSYTADFFKP